MRRLIVKRLNRLDDDKSSRVIIKTRLADDRRRVHILKQARFRSNGNAATARYGHRKEVCVRNTGIAKLFGCSLPTANRIKKSGKIDKAITQIGRKIIVDVELALELAGKKTGGRK